MKITYNLILGCLVILMTSCQGKTSQKQNTKPLTKQQLSYAKGFSISKDGHKTILDIYSPKDTSKLLQSFTLMPADYNQALKENEIKVPCRRIICLSSTQLAYLIELDALDNIVGINSSRHLFNQNINDKVKANAIQKVGKEGIFNIETIVSLSPDVIFVSPFKTGGYDAIKNLGVPLVPMAAFAEQTPLGRAEWIKMLALFADKEAAADSIYTAIEADYLRLKKLTQTVEHRPSVFSGKMKGGTWYAAGGDSFFAHYFRDAGADYIIKNQLTASMPMDYESIYSLAAKADYWRLLTSSPNGFGKQMLKEEDERYADFKAYKTGNVLVCNLRQVPYREESAIKPNILLADYIYHFHPKLLPDYQPRYWKKIEE
ncbi:ABC transporter substrate-binding protein [Carboxylicivirga sp. A043]|uniref:ABC transporter substrate-binding protein n=1 Tax=Carboxylicivirga litoralis TaxID=2816963 RepID=UPI0021CB6777|nr:ABC transporter substrate-binding protein [Carboxylicivirga sp. A043]MCU4155114.1 ABC transporter substrate-binding protein [Carboxylicivirga sp. A043]